jgi:hypothetical protein
VPANVEVETKGLTNSTTLEWKPNLEPDLAGYEIVWRDTTAPLWQHTLSVGNVTRFTVPVSKDNVLFGVRAIDKDGNKGAAAYPVPHR